MDFVENVDLASVNLFDSDVYAERVPHEWFAELRRSAPVWRQELPDGRVFWNVTRHEDLTAVNRDASNYSSWLASSLTMPGMEDILDQQRLMMVNMDPPEHTKLRKVVNKGFTPAMIRQLQEHLAEEARTIVAEAVETGDVEFVEQVACELPLIAIAEFLGVPREDRRRIFDLSNRMVGAEDPDYQVDEEEAMAAMIEMYAYAQELADERKANPRDDIVSKLLSAEVDGEHLTVEEFNVFFLLLAVAGNETTRNAISHGINAMIEHPDQWALLRANPELVDSAVEEILRWATPVNVFRRVATCDVELHGQAIAEGDSVAMFYASGNHDADVFKDPFTFDITRDPNPHLTFGGGGPHFCLGANLARLEMRTLFSELARQCETIELTGDVGRLRSYFINGIKTLPVRLTPGS